MRRPWVLVLLLAPAAGGDEDEIDYGAYDPFVVEDVRADVARRVRELFAELVVPECASCKGSGVVWVKRKTFTKPQGGGPPRPVTVDEKIDCPTCQGKPAWRKEQKKKTHERFLTMAGVPKPERKRWRYRLESLKDEQRLGPKRLLCDVSRKTAVVTMPGHKLTPFRLQRRQGEWIFHDDDQHGLFEPPAAIPRLRTTAKVLEVLAADVLRLDVHDNAIVRVCGIVIPHGDQPVPTKVGKPDANARAVVARWVQGKTVTLMHDDYARMTTAGRPIVYVAFDDGKDLGEELLREGIAYPLLFPVINRPVVHMRFRAYDKAAREAVKARRGWWKRLSPPK